MSNYIVDSADLTAVANAIRERGGTSAQLAFPAGFVQAIEDIPIGTALSNPPIKAVSGTFIPASSSVSEKIMVDPDIIDLNDYILWSFWAIMPDEYWANYEGDSTYDNKYSGLLLSRFANYWPSTIAAQSISPMFYTPNANNHSWKSGGTYSTSTEDNSITITAYNTSGYRFIPGAEYRYILVCARRLTE